MLAIWDFSTGYQIVGTLHVLAAIAAFGPLFVYPSLQRAGAGATIARLHLRLALPSLVLVWVLGMGMVGMSEDTFEMSQTWIVLSLIGWVILMVVSWFLIRPSLTDDSDAGPAPIQATRLPFFFTAFGGSSDSISPLLSAATRFRRQIATGSGLSWVSSTRPRRQAGSQGRSQVRPRMPGKTFDFQLIM